MGEGRAVRENLIRSLNECWSIIQRIEIKDVIDMIIIAFVIYHVLIFIRRSRSGQVARAIVLLLVAFAIANFFKLKVVTFFMNNALELGFLSLVIIFQPELRRVLEQMGSGKLRELFVAEAAEEEVPAAISQTVAAYTSMSRDKVGALMVFERKTMLDDVIKSGTPLDAAVSAELLKNLFWDKAPLHDGAVIVRGGRIVGAGCMLPLSGNTNLSRDLGMRHRAGIGISENSDAVVAIVSEETGSISVAVGGMLKRHLSPETLERLLKNELAPGEEARKPSTAQLLTNVLRGKKGDKSDGKENS